MLSIYFYQGYEHYFPVSKHVRKAFYGLFNYAHYSCYATVPLIPFDIDSDDQSSDDDAPPFYPPHYATIHVIFSFIHRVSKQMMISNNPIKYLKEKKLNELDDYKIEMVTELKVYEKVEEEGGEYKVIQEKRFKVKEEEWLVDEEKLYEMFTKQTEVISKCLNEIKV